MSDGFGAGFFALALLGVVGALAVGLAALGVAAVALRRHRGRVPDPLRYLAAVLLATVVVVTGFGVLAMVDEAPLAAVLLLVLVALPLALAAARARSRGAGPLDAAVTAAVAWSGPYVVAAVVEFALLANAASFGVATAVAGAAVVGGSLALVGVLDDVLGAAPG